MSLDVIPKSIDNAIQNVSDQPSKMIGTTLSDIWYLVFGGISYLADKKRIKYSVSLNQFEYELRKEIDSIPEDNIIEPDFQTTAQALEAAKYCITSDLLRKMFVNLISGSLNKEYEQNVHPSFPDILKKISERDAKFLKTICKIDSIPSLDIGIYVDDKKHEFNILKHNCILPYGELSETECTISAAYLESVGILSISTGDMTLADKTQYEQFKHLHVYKETESLANKRGVEMFVSEGICSFTNMGEEFVRVCVR